MTDADEVRELIAGTRPDEWIPFPDMGVWTYRSDVDLRVTRYEQLDPNFRAPWTEPVQAGCQSYSYLVYYGNSPVEYHVVVGVDDFRAHVPLPREPAGPSEPYTITPYQADLGRIITGDAETFAAYRNQTGIQVRGDTESAGPPTPPE